MVSAVSEALPSIEEVWAWLREVPDPEIPVVSVVDLGIVREVSWRNGECVVTVTPTYSGCPATAVIATTIRAALASHGLGDVRLETKIAPPWTTDWMTEVGKESLRRYGIAPPRGRADEPGPGGLTPRGVPCPLCGSISTSVTSPFGSTPCKALYRCDDCLEPFDYFKCH